MRRIPPPARAWVAQELALTTLRALGEVAEAAQVDAVTIKGAAFLGLDIGRPDRVLADVDVLPLDFTKFLNRLGGTTGWAVGEDQHHSVVCTFEPTRFRVDLHRSPLPRGMGRMTTLDLYARAARVPRLHHRLWAPAFVDMFLIAIAHWVKDRLGALGDRGSAIVQSDLVSIVSSAPGLTPDDVVLRATSFRLRRLIGLGLAELSHEDPRWEPYRDHAIGFAESVVLEQIASWVENHPEHPRLGYWMVRSVADTPHDALLSLALQGLDSLTGRWRRSRHQP